MQRLRGARAGPAASHGQRVHLPGLGRRRRAQPRARLQAGLQLHRARRSSPCCVGFLALSALGQCLPGVFGRGAGLPRSRISCCPRAAPTSAWSTAKRRAAGLKELFRPKTPCTCSPCSSAPCCSSTASTPTSPCSCRSAHLGTTADVSVVTSSISVVSFLVGIAYGKASQKSSAATTLVRGVRVPGRAACWPSPLFGLQLRHGASWRAACCSASAPASSRSAPSTTFRRRSTRSVVTMAISVLRLVHLAGRHPVAPRHQRPAGGPCSVPKSAAASLAGGGMRVRLPGAGGRPVPCRGQRSGGSSWSARGAANTQSIAFGAVVWAMPAQAHFFIFIPTNRCERAPNVGKLCAVGATSLGRRARKGVGSVEKGARTRVRGSTGFRGEGGSDGRSGVARQVRTDDRRDGDERGLPAGRRALTFATSSAIRASCRRA